MVVKESVTNLHINVIVSPYRCRHEEDEEVVPVDGTGHQTGIPVATRWLMRNPMTHNAPVMRGHLLLLPVAPAMVNSQAVARGLLGPHVPNMLPFRTARTCPVVIDLPVASAINPATPWF